MAFVLVVGVVQVVVLSYVFLARVRATSYLWSWVFSPLRKASELYSFMNSTLTAFPVKISAQPVSASMDITMISSRLVFSRKQVKRRYISGYRVSFSPLPDSLYWCRFSPNSLSRECLSSGLLHNVRFVSRWLSRGSLLGEPPYRRGFELGVRIERPQGEGCRTDWFDYFRCLARHSARFVRHSLKQLTACAWFTSSVMF